METVVEAGSREQKAEMRRVVRTMVHGEYEAFPPHDLLRSVWKLVPSFAGNEQQDAHEFMRFLLDRLRKELSSGRYLIRMRGVVTPRRKEQKRPCFSQRASVSQK